MCTDEKYPFPTLKNVDNTADITAGWNITEFAGGNGTLFYPYKIATAEHFNNIRNYPDAQFELISDISFDQSFGKWQEIGLDYWP